MTDEQKREDAIRRTMAALRDEIALLWSARGRHIQELRRYVRQGQTEQELALRRDMQKRTEALQDEIAQYRRQLPPFMGYRDGFYEMVPVTPELIAQAERMDQEARR